MKAKLLKKLRDEGRSKINIISFTKTNGIYTGMSYGFDDDEYRGLFKIGDTESSIKEKAARIYINTHINYFRKKYFNFKKINKNKPL